MRSLEYILVVIYEICINTKIPFSLTHKEFATRVHSLFFTSSDQLQMLRIRKTLLTSICIVVLWIDNWIIQSLLEYHKISKINKGDGLVSKFIK